MNRAILVGTIVSAPNKVPVGDSSVTKFRLKTVEQISVNGELKERSQTHLIDVWSPYLQKEVTPLLREGQMVGLEGSIESRNVAKQGDPARWTTTIVLRGSGSSLNVFGGPGSGVSTRADVGDGGDEVRVDHSRKPAPALADDGLGDDVPF